MVRLSAWALAFGLLLTSIPGCGPGDPPPVARKAPPAPTGSGGQEEEGAPAGNSGGVPTRQSNDAGGDAMASGAAEAGPAPEPEMRMIGGVMRRLPVASAGGGPPMARPKTSTSGSTAAAGGMLNGLFPNMGAGGASMVSGFGALFPTSGGGGGSAGSAAGASTGGAGGPNRPVASMDGRTPASAAPKSEARQPETFLDAAAKAFEKGDAVMGHRALYAQVLLDKDAFEQFPLELYDQVGEPRLFLNWGIGVNFTSPGDFSGLPPLIGDAVEEPAARGPSGGSDEMGVSPGQSASSGASAASRSRYGKVNTDVPIGMMMYYSGDYAVRLYKRMNDRRVGEYFGKIVAKMPERIPAAGQGGVANEVAQTNQPQSVPASRRNRPVASGPGGEIMGTAPPTAPDATEGGGGGKAGATKSPSSLPLLQRWSVSDEAREPGNVTGLVLPGVVSVGEGNVETLTDRAQKMGLDALLVLDVKVTKDKRTFISANILRLYDPEDSKKVLVQGRSLKNAQVAKDREKTRESNDPVEVELDKVFKDFVDINLKAKKLEGWDGNKAAQYVDSLVAKKVDKFRAAAETLGLYRMGILSADKCKSVLDQLMSGSGSLLMAGKDSDKKSFLEGMMTSESSSGGDSIR